MARANGQSAEVRRARRRRRGPRHAHARPQRRPRPPAHPPPTQAPSLRDARAPRATTLSAACGDRGRAAAQTQGRGAPGLEEEPKGASSRTRSAARAPGARHRAQRRPSRYAYTALDTSTGR